MAGRITLDVSSLSTIALVASTILCVLLYKLNKSRGLLPLPPGPRPRPIIGNLFDMPPKDREWLFWAKHKDLYGPISSLRALGSTFIMVHDLKIANDLLEKKSAVYSNRPVFTMSFLSGWSLLTPLRSYDDKFRRQRKLMHQCMGTRNLITRSHGHMHKEARFFAYNLLQSPEKFFGHVRMFTGACIINFTYGYDIDHHAGVEDPLVHLAEQAMTTFIESIRYGAWLVDLVPQLKHIPTWFPGGSFQKTAAGYSAWASKFVEKPFEFAKQQKAAAVDAQCFVSDFLDTKGYPPDELDNAKWSAASMYAGGTDSTTAVLCNFFLAMVLYPEVQKKAQEELDMVVGSNALPTFEDWGNLPYLNACAMEAYRWHPPGPINLPHNSDRDDAYNGYFIPKNSIVMVNLWYLTHDPERYHDPLAFKPERYLRHRRPDTGDIEHEPEYNPKDIVFGFGRRSCPGALLSESTLAIGIAMLLSLFNIEQPDSVGPGERAPGLNFSSGMVSQALPFKCKITPRSDKARDLVLALERDPFFEKTDAAKMKELLGGGFSPSL